MYTPPRTSSTVNRGHETSSEHTLEHSPAMAAYLRNQELMSQPPGKLLSELSADFVRLTYEDLQDSRGHEVSKTYPVILNHLLTCIYL